MIKKIIAAVLAVLIIIIFVMFFVRKDSIIIYQTFDDFKNASKFCEEKKEEFVGIEYDEIHIHEDGSKFYSYKIESRLNKRYTENDVIKIEKKDQLNVNDSEKYILKTNYYSISYPVYEPWTEKVNDFNTVRFNTIEVPIINYMDINYDIEIDYDLDKDKAILTDKILNDAYEAFKENVEENYIKDCFYDVIWFLKLIGVVSLIAILILVICFYIELSDEEENEV